MLLLLGNNTRAGKGYATWAMALVYMLVLFGVHIHDIYAQHNELELRYADLQNGTIDESVFTRAVLKVSAGQGSVSDSISTLQKYKDKVHQPKNSTEVYDRIALLAEMTAQYDIAIENYTRVVDQRPVNDRTRYDTLLKLAALYFNKGNFKEALLATKQILLGARQDEVLHRAHILQARIEGYAVDFSASIQKLQRFIEQNPTSPQLRLAYTTLAELHQRTGNVDALARTEHTITTEFPHSIEAHYEYSNSVSSIINFPLPLTLLYSNISGIHAHPFTDTQAASENSDVAVHTALSESSAHTAAHAPTRSSATHVSSVVSVHTAPLSGSLLSASSVPNSSAIIKIQAGFFRNRAYAHTLQEKIANLGLKTLIDQEDTEGGTRYKVQVLVNESDYPSVRNTLDAHNIKGFVVK